MISKEKIIEITEKGREKGYDIRVKDISYVLLCKHFEDNTIAYRVLFGTDVIESEILEYNSSEKVRFLRSLINDITNTMVMSSKTDIEFTFDMNKEAMIREIENINQLEADGMIEPKDAARLRTDIRTKLNDKFKVEDVSEQQYVIIEPKCNHICEWTHKECWLQTKEYAMKHWNLVEKDK